MSGRTVYLETFGCQMNELDSELVAGQLASLGYRFTSEAGQADVVLYNTCSVREQAEQKVWSRLGELKAAKRRRPGLIVGVLGCMAERDGASMIDRFPVVDVMCGPGELDKLPRLLDNAVRTRASLLGDAEPDARANGAGPDAGLDGLEGLIALQGNSSRRTATLAAAEDSLELLDLSRAVSPIDPAGGVGGGGARRSAYVRITRGCNKFCTYCVVPFTRGAEVHRPPDHIIDECRRLADAGAIEITLLGQTVNHYRYEHGAAVLVNGVAQPQKGRSFKGGHRRDPLGGAGTNVTTFADLLKRIHDEVPAIQRLRFVTSYPRDFGDDVLEVMRDSPRICRYLHVPAQSGSDRVLKKMNRGYTVGEYFDFLDRARAYLDEPEKGRPLSLSGDVIVGFPTETDEDFAATIDLVRRARYKNCFIFKYSPRPGTVAWDRIPDDVPEVVKRRRNNDLLAVQAEISDGIGQEQVGRTFDVMVEGYSQKELKRRGMTKGEIRAAGAVTLTVAGREARAAAMTAGATATLEARSPAGRKPDQLGAEAVPCVQLSGRTDGDLIVFFEAPVDAAPEGIIGRILPVRITSADRLSLFGEMI
jgi:tRNA-2-methylthio-N6-dimethylallyladenosine synthase